MEDNKLKTKNVETYTADMVKALEGDKGGLIKKIIHEEEEHEALKKNLSPNSRKNRVFMFISVVLIILALGALIFLTFFNGKVDTVSVIPQSASIIFVDQTDFKAVDGLTKDQMINALSGQINNTKIKIGGINAIYLTENNKVIGFKEFIRLMEGNLTADQLSLFDDSFLLGAFKSGLNPISPDVGDPFILLKVRSFSDIFPVMQSWENKILYDLSGLFGVSISPDTNYLFTKGFEDGIVANKNARILYDNNGNIVLMYVFADDNSVIVTNSELATQEIILRLNSSKIKK